MNLSELPDKLVLFDGECNFCSFSARFLLRFNTKESLTFSSLQSEYGKFIVDHFKIQNDSIVYVTQQQAYTEIDAIFLILEELHFVFQVFKILKIFPKSSLNFLYKTFSKHRYTIFGKKVKCEILPEKFKKRFL